MAWTRKKPSGKYEGSYRDAEGKVRVAGTFAQPKQALREAERVESEQRQPTALDIDGGKITWGAWFEMWHESRVLSYSTYTQYPSLARNHVLPRWRDTPIKDITHFGVSKWIAELSRSNSPHVVGQVLQMFRASLNAAIKANRLATNPTANVKPPTKPEGLERYLTPDEVEDITSFMDTTDSLIVWVSVLTGLRFGELAGLHWDRVDLETGRIHVVEKFDQKARVIDPLPKDEDTRTVKMTPWLRDKLRDYYNTRTLGRTCGVAHNRGSRCRGDLVFRGKQGRAIKSAAWNAGPWKRAKQLAGITDRVRAHDMRHTYASWLVQQGMSLEKVSKRLGHADTQMSQRYSHLREDDDNDEATEALQAYMERRRGGSNDVQSARLRTSERNDSDGVAAAQPGDDLRSADSRKTAN